jgi:hypothetical protein
MDSKVICKRTSPPLRIEKFRETHGAVTFFSILNFQ